MKQRATALRKTTSIEQLAAKLLELLESAQSDDCLLSSGSLVRIQPV